MAWIRASIPESDEHVVRLIDTCIQQHRATLVNESKTLLRINDSVTNLHLRSKDLLEEFRIILLALFKTCTKMKSFGVDAEWIPGEERRHAGENSNSVTTNTETRRLFWHKSNSNDPDRNVWSIFVFSLGFRPRYSVDPAHTPGNTHCSERIVSALVKIKSPMGRDDEPQRFDS